MKFIKRINEQKEKEYEDDINYLLSNLTDEGFKIDYKYIQDPAQKTLFIRIWKPLSESDYSYLSSINFDWLEIEEEVQRAFLVLSKNREFKINYLYTMEVSSTTPSGYIRSFWKQEDLMKGINTQSIKSFSISIIVD